ncbi:hypothetical protein LINPERHAP2_LOCUS38937, partial [Linum perenne]
SQPSTTISSQPSIFFIFNPQPLPLPSSSQVYRSERNRKRRIEIGSAIEIGRGRGGSAIEIRRGRGRIWWRLGGSSWCWSEVWC